MEKEIKKPEPSDFGYSWNNSYEEEGGWMFEGGEDAYYEALKKWKNSQSKEV